MSMWERPFSVVTDGERYFVVAQVEEKAARRAKAILDASDVGGERLAQVVEDALNLHAMPGLIARATR